MKKKRVYLFYSTFILMSCSDHTARFSVDKELLDSHALHSAYEQYYSNVDSTCIVPITHDQLRERKEITLNLPKHCDSVDIEIPFGGTVTSACFYEDSTVEKPVSESVSFMLGLLELKENCITVSSQLNGRYFLRYGSCHWGSQMWVNFK
jgi:hypothetical protein